MKKLLYFHHVASMTRSMIISKIINGPFHDYVSDIVSSKWFNYAILIVVTLHNIFVAMTTSYIVKVKTAWYLKTLEGTFLAFYIMESGLKIYAKRLKFFKNPLNDFDLIILFNFLLHFSDVFTHHSIIAYISATISACMGLRILRQLIILHYMKRLQVIFSAVLKSLPALGSIVILITLFLYLFTIIGRGIYSEVDDGRYGNLGKASLTLFQLLTLDEWFSMYTDIINNNTGYQHVIVYLVLFIVLETFIFVNLFVAVIVDNLARVQEGLHSHNEDETTLSEGNSKDIHVQRRKEMIPPTLSDDLYPVISQTIDHYYPQLSTKDKLLHKRYWQLLASLEHNMCVTQKHQCILDELVYLVDFTKN